MGMMGQASCYFNTYSIYSELFWGCVLYSYHSSVQVPTVTVYLYRRKTLL
jgi:hypothetical protein